MKFFTPIRLLISLAVPVVTTGAFFALKPIISQPPKEVEEVKPVSESVEPATDEDSTQTIETTREIASSTSQTSNLEQTQRDDPNPAQDSSNGGSAGILSPSGTSGSGGNGETGADGVDGTENSQDTLPNLQDSQSGGNNNPGGGQGNQGLTGPQGPSGLGSQDNTPNRDQGSQGSTLDNPNEPGILSSGPTGQTGPSGSPSNVGGDDHDEVEEDANTKEATKPAETPPTKDEGGTNPEPIAVDIPGSSSGSSSNPPNQQPVGTQGVTGGAPGDIGGNGGANGDNLGNPGPSSGPNGDQGATGDTGPSGSNGPVGDTTQNIEGSGQNQELPGTPKDEEDETNGDGSENPITNPGADNGVMEDGMSGFVVLPEIFDVLSEWNNKRIEQPNEVDGNTDPVETNPSGSDAPQDPTGSLGNPGVGTGSNNVIAEPEEPEEPEEDEDAEDVDFFVKFFKRQVDFGSEVTGEKILNNKNKVTGFKYVITWEGTKYIVEIVPDKQNIFWFVKHYTVHRRKKRDKRGDSVGGHQFTVVKQTPPEETSDMTEEQKSKNLASWKTHVKNLRTSQRTRVLNKLKKTLRASNDEETGETTGGGT